MSGSVEKAPAPPLGDSFGKAAATPKQPAKKRLPPFSLRLTAEERLRLKQDAGNRPLAAHIRQKLFGNAATRRKHMMRRPSQDHAAIGRVLGALGQSRLASNLNQIAKAANMGNLPVTPELAQELRQACADIRVMRHELITALGVKLETGQ